MTNTHSPINGRDTPSIGTQPVRQRIANILCALFIATACQHATAEQGVVLDKATRKPIAGAIVDTSWTGAVWQVVQTRSVCYDLEVTTSDAEGRFTVSTIGKFRPLLQFKNRGTSVVVPGYDVDPSSNVLELEFLMVPRQGTKGEQFAKITRYLNRSDCPDAARKMHPVLKVVQKELSSLATTERERATVRSLLREVENYELSQSLDGKARANQPEETPAKTPSNSPTPKQEKPQVSAPESSEEKK